MQKPKQRAPQDKTKGRLRAERAVHNKQADSNTSDQEFDTGRTKTFNFHIIQLVLITKLKMKLVQIQQN